ncbi:MAG: hypothetical protein JOZ18_03035 [Chloroflexi bacterium]|nr:hypothetical protein [Chloroflexota bacterium]
MFESANQSEPFKRFLEEFFGRLTYIRWHEGADVSLLHQLSAQEQRLAENLMIEANDNQLRSQAAHSLLAIYHLPDEEYELLFPQRTGSSQSSDPKTHRVVDMAKLRQTVTSRVGSSDQEVRETAIAELLASCKGRLLPPC